MQETIHILDLKIIKNLIEAYCQTKGLKFNGFVNIDDFSHINVLKFGLLPHGFESVPISEIYRELSAKNYLERELIRQLKNLQFYEYDSSNECLKEKIKAEKENHHQRKIRNQKEIKRLKTLTDNLQLILKEVNEQNQT